MAGEAAKEAALQSEAPIFHLIPVIPPLPKLPRENGFYLMVEKCSPNQQ
jgi:hypothetical protein